MLQKIAFFFEDSSKLSSCLALLESRTTNAIWSVSVSTWSSLLRSFRFCYTLKKNSSESLHMNKSPAFSLPPDILVFSLALVLPSKLKETSLKCHLLMPVLWHSGLCCCLYSGMPYWVASSNHGCSALSPASYKCTQEISGWWPKDLNSCQSCEKSGWGFC